MATGMVLTACGDGGGSDATKSDDGEASEGQGGETGASTDDVGVDDLEAMLLTVDNLPDELSDPTAEEVRDVPNEVKANTSGDEEPVTPGDPDYENLTEMEEWTRLGGVAVRFAGTVEGLEVDIDVELDLTETEEGAHDFFVGWFASEPEPCDDLSAANESHCGPYLSIDLDIDGERETLHTPSAIFRVGRIIGDVSVSTTTGSGEDLDPEVEGLPEELAVLLYENIQEQLEDTDDGGDGESGTESDAPGDSEQTEETGEETDATSGSIEPGADFCDVVVNPTDLTLERDHLEDLAEVAPTDLEDDYEVLVDAIDAAGVDTLDQALDQAVSDGDEEAIQAITGAVGNIGAYIAQQCT